MRNTEKNARRGSVATVRAASGNRTAAPIPSRMRTTATIRSRPRRPRIFARKGRGLYTRWRAPSYPGEEPGQDRLLRMQTVLGLIEYDRLGPVDHLLGDLESSMGRKAVHHDRVLLRVVEEGGVDLVQAEHLLALLLLFLLAHRNPDVRVDDVGALHGSDRIVDDSNRGSALFRDGACGAEELGVGLVAARASRRHGHADDRRPEEQRIADVVPVPDIGQLQLLERAAFVLEDREQVRDDLAR